MIEILEKAAEMPEGLTFGKRVRWKRQELKLSQEKLARRLGLCRETIGEYEHDRSVPRTTEMKQKLAAALEMSCDDLYDNTVGAVAVNPKEPVGIGLNFGQLRRSFKKSGGQQLRDWKRMFKYLLTYTETLTDEDRREIDRCIGEIISVQKERRKANRGGAHISR